MLRFLQVEKGKPIESLTASAAMVTGAICTKDYAGNIGKTVSGLGDYLVDAPKNYTGLNSIVNPTDAESTAIPSGSKCSAVVAKTGERYATSEVTPGYADVGDPLNASNGKLVRAAGESAYQWVYGGLYRDPAGTLYIIERVEPGTAAATKTVTYNSNGGTGTMTDARSPYYVGKVALALNNTFVAPTYKDFVDWDTAANGSGTNYDPGDEITIGSSNIVLYAQYEDTHTKLVLNANTGTGTMTDASKYYEEEVITVPASTFTPPVGKGFVKWNTAANGSGTDYDPGDEITVTDDMIGAATTLYAIWADVYSVTYDANEGTGTMTDPDSPYFATSAVTVYECTFTPPESKVFNGYNSAANGTGDAYTPGTPFAISADVTLYAQWIDED